jgi:Flp pilus assembly protein TadG
MAKTPVADTSRRRWAALLRQRRSVVALEFALCATPLLLLLIGTIEIAYDLYVQSALDYAVSVAARQVQVGAVIGTSGETSSTFAAAALCPTLAPLLSCSLVTVAVAPVTTGYDYYSNPTTLSFTTASSSGGSICTGTAASVMQMEAWYLGPTFVTWIVPAFSTTYSGRRVHVTISSAGFVNEQFSGGQTTGVGC